ncbi:hypothetical protein O7623_26715 [Solwaraspora sp. WMMD791]|uniref:hypothetical protein n=1 Tax=Solwaraspora sp. WMMD791 TaxID=3016086 RepID=UPI00249A6381|nr:hypothetical protein [Solwaraspora sp. WMMD791]WFE26828.1 hypothetical protein O7623_26715 [Solwaraspora sp. WMMD791]
MAADTSATREVLFVVGVALLGVALALASVLTPWYVGPTATTGPSVVEMRAPQHPPATTGIDAAPPR